MNTEKHLRLTGSSTVSWKDAVVQTIKEASETIDFISSVSIIKQWAKIDEKRISEYFVDLDLGFIIDRDRNLDNID